MKLLRLYYLLFIFLFCVKGFSQSNTSTLFSKNKPLLCLSLASPRFSEPKYSMLTQLSKTKKPMFCQLEDNLCKRFNIWILFRAGSDADYQKLIAPPQYHFGYR